MKKTKQESVPMIHRRHFLRESAAGLGALALGSLAAQEAAGSLASSQRTSQVVPRAKSVIFLFMAGGPSHVDLLDPKPLLQKLDGQPMPASLMRDDRFAFLRGTPRVLGSPFRFHKHGQSGTELSELLPHLAEVVDDIAVVRSMYTTSHHHAPAQRLMHTGNVDLGRPSLGAWATHGLQRAPRGLPGFAVFQSGGGQPAGGDGCWDSGFLPSGCRGMRLQEGDLTNEPESILAMYGAEPGQGSFANNCLMARRLVERGAAFVQVAHRGWDTHGTGCHDDLVHALPEYCRQTDRAAAALVKDLKQRGLLDSTLVVWGGEFGRTPMRQQSAHGPFVGRDHHPHAFSIWMAGGGIRPGITVGRTDAFGYRVVEDAVSVADLQATILHCLGLNYRRLAAKHHDQEVCLTEGKPIRRLLA